jgi:methionyl aminopeptidase
LPVVLKTRAEIETMRRANAVVVEVLNDLAGFVKPGMNTMDLEERAREKLKAVKKAKSAFLGYRGYPAVLCASVNEEVVHGIPSRKKVLKPGDILSLDFGVELDGYFGDAAMTVPLGPLDEEKTKLLEVTRRCLDHAIREMSPGRHLSDIARAVSGCAEANGFSVVYQFVGHGIGRAMHEEPQVPNCGKPRPDTRLMEGMVLALEPMINAGVADVKVLEDDWTVVTADGRPSAHFEKSVAVGPNGPEILSLW